MSCKNCGGAMSGDGYTTVLHCEEVDVIGEGYEPDAKPVWCDYDVRCDVDHPFHEDFLVESYQDPSIRE